MPASALSSSKFYGDGWYGGYAGYPQVILYGDGTSSGDDDVDKDLNKN